MDNFNDENNNLNQENNTEIKNDQTNMQQNSIESTNIISNNTSIGNNDESQKNKEPLATASLILGIISILLFFLNVLILPVAVIGLILGIVNKTKKGKKVAGIILNTIAIILIIILLGIVFTLVRNGINKISSEDIIGRLYNEIEYSTSQNFVAGKYDCTSLNNKSEYLISLELNKDNTFIYGKYGDLINNHAAGTYTYEYENKTNNTDNYKYYMLTLSGTNGEFIVDGKKQDREFNSKMEFGITSNLEKQKKEGPIIFTSNYNMYYCYER